MSLVSHNATVFTFLAWRFIHHCLVQKDTNITFFCRGTGAQNSIGGQAKKGRRADWSQVVFLGRDSARRHKIPRTQRSNQGNASSLASSEHTKSPLKLPGYRIKHCVGCFTKLFKWVISWKKKLKLGFPQQFLILSHTIVVLCFASIRFF